MTTPNNESPTVECMIGLTLQIKDREFLRTEVRLNGVNVGASREEIEQAVDTWSDTFDIAKDKLLNKVTEYLTQ